MYLKHVPLSGDSPQHAPSLSDSRPIIWRFQFIMYLNLPCHLYFRKRQLRFSNSFISGASRGRSKRTDRIVGVKTRNSHTLRQACAAQNRVQRPAIANRMLG